MAIDEQYLKQWIGRSEQQVCVINDTPLNAMAATLDREDAPYQRGEPLPNLWHWLYFLPNARMSQVSADGHPKRGGFLPPVTLPRRMWAGGRLSFHGPVPVGAEVERTSRIMDVSHKSGRSGDLVFVKVSHELAVSGQVLVREEQDIVYRDPPQPGEPAPAPKLAPTAFTWECTVTPDPVLLFRYSALTFNSHRIHYDRPYAIAEEGYPGLVVHGPLLASMLMNLLRDQRPDASVQQFSFRAMRPIFDLAPFSLRGKLSDDGRSVHLWAQDAEGYLCMDAQAEIN